MTEIDDAELTRFGIRPEDEGFHRYDPAERWWNESWFWDWYDEDGSVAGHCRLGTFPGQDRLWLWLFLWQDGAWTAVEEPRLPFSLLRRPALALDSEGLSFEWFPHAPLRRGELRVETFGRVISGPDSGRTVPVGVELEVTGTGAPHSTGQHSGEGHSSDHYDARRFEQPIRVSGHQRSGASEVELTGNGERDHSWGPRVWDMEWTFVAANAGDRSLQCVEVRIGDLDPIHVGYFLEGGVSHDLAAVSLDVTLDSSRLDSGAASGRLSVGSGEGRLFTASFEAISAHTIDLAHTQVPPHQTDYRRHLIRLTPAGGGEPFCGWLETHMR